MTLYRSYGKPDAVPEFSSCDRKIARAIERMFEAKQDCWAYRWADLAYRLMNEKRRGKH